MLREEARKHYCRNIADVATYFQQTWGWPTYYFLEKFNGLTPEEKTAFVFGWCINRKRKFNGEPIDA